MAYKRYFYRNGKKFGPYFYESYRDENGKVRKRYVGTEDPNKKVTPTKSKKILSIFLLIFFVFGVFLFLNVNNFNSVVVNTPLEVSKSIVSYVVANASVEQVEKEYNSEEIDLKIKNPESFAGQVWTKNKNQRMDFELPEGSVRLYFDLMNSSKFAEEVDKKIKLQINETQTNVDINEKIINKTETTPMKNTSMENITKQAINISEIKNLKKEINDSNKNEELVINESDEVDSIVNETNSEEQIEDKTKKEEKDKSEENEIIENEDNEKKQTKEEVNKRKNETSITGNIIKGITGFFVKITGKEVYDEDDGKGDNGEKEYKEKNEINHSREIAKLGEKELKEIEENSSIEAEGFDIKVDESESKAVTKENSKPDYKWGYKVKLKDLQFMAKVDITTNKSISVVNNDTLRIDNKYLLSFKDLVEQGYKIRFERPFLENITLSKISNVSINQTLDKIINKTTNETLKPLKNETIIEINDTEIKNKTIVNETDEEEIQNETIVNETFVNETEAIDEKPVNETEEIEEGEKNETKAEVEKNQTEEQIEKRINETKEVDEGEGEKQESQESDVEEETKREKDKKEEKEGVGFEEEIEKIKEEVKESDVEEEKAEEKITGGKDESEESETTKSESEKKDEEISEPKISIMGNIIKSFVGITGRVSEKITKTISDEKNLEYKNTVTIYIERDFTEYNKLVKLKSNLSKEDLDFSGSSEKNLVTRNESLDEINQNFKNKISNLIEVNYRDIDNSGDVSIGDFIELDPTLVIEDVAQGDLTNVTIQNEFSHLNVSTTDPYDGLFLYMPFDTNTSQTTVYDYTDNENDGTINNDAHFITSGKYGGAFDFDGVGDYIDLSYSKGTTPLENRTLSAWIYSKGANSANDIQGIISVMGHTGGYDRNAQNLLLVNVSGTGVKCASYLDVDHASTSYHVIPLNQWSHVVCKFNISGSNEDASLYVNNQHKETESGNGNYQYEVTEIRIGAYKIGDRFFNGYIDEAMYFDTALTSTQISNIYNNQSARFKNPGKQKLSLDLGSGNEFKAEFYNLSVDDSWTTVDLDLSYTTPVIVCSLENVETNDPIVTRIKDVSGTEFNVTLQNPSGNAVSSHETYCIIMEEGAYTIDNVNVEAYTVTSDGTNENNDWGSGNMENVGYTKSYTDPVVLGQVMSYNDADWSVFWSSGSTRSDPPDSSNLYVGKHVGEDTDTTRSNEELGYIVFEENADFTYEGFDLRAQNTADSVEGMDNTPPFVYDTSNQYDFGVVSQQAMDGSHGSWAVLYGTDPFASTNIDVAVDEDQIGDSERAHTTEEVSYLVVNQTGNIDSAYAIQDLTGYTQVNVTTNYQDNLNTSLNLSLGYYDGSWHYTDYQTVTGNNIFDISDTTTNLTLNYTFYAGSDAGDYNFYTPILQSVDTQGISQNLSLELEDATEPDVSFEPPTLSDGSTTGNDWLFVNVSASDTNNLSTFIDFDNSLVSWWRMDDVNSSGDPTDYLGINNGTAVDNAAQTDAGYLGKGFEFDGAGDNVQLSNLDLTGGIWTISMWQYYLGDADDRTMPIGKDDGNTYIGTYYDLDRVYFKNSSGAVNYYVSTTLNLNEWNHFTYVGNTTDVLVYKDGVYQGIALNSGNSLIPSFNIADIGTGYSTSSYDFNGTMDDVMIFNRSLSADEIKGLYANSSEKYTSNNFTGLSEGDYGFTAYAQDTAGNVNSSSRTLSVDQTSPDVSFEPPTLSNGSSTSNNWLFVNVSANDTGRGSNNVSTFIDFDNSLVSWWRMDDVNSSGDPTDYLGINNGTAVDNAAQTDVGYLGKGFEFDGAGDYVEVSNANSLDFGGGNFTLTAWVKTNNIDSGWYSIYEYDRLGVNWFGLWREGNQFHFRVGGNGGNFNFDQTIQADKWYFVVGTYDTASNNNTKYLNGKLDSSDNKTGGAWSSNVDNLVIGAKETKDEEYWNGTIDDVMIFNRSLSADEIKGLYANSSEKYTSNNFTGLSEGDYGFTAYAQDEAGNVNSSSRTLSIDQTAPTITIDSPLTDQTSSETLFNVSINEEVEWCGLSLDNSNNITMNLNATKTGAGYINSSMTDGSHSFVVTCNDSAGNYNSSSGSFLSDLVNITVCRDLTQANTIYTLQDDLSITGTCLVVKANNITVDGNGYEINYSSDGGDDEYGVFSNGYNQTTVKNCVIKEGVTTGDYDYAVYLNNSNNGTIQNNTITTSGIYGYGIHLFSSSNSTLTSNNITTSGVWGRGIYLFSSSNSTLNSNTITTSRLVGYGIYLYSSSNSTLTSNTITTSGLVGYGIHLWSSSDSTLTSNTITTSNSSGYGLYLDSSSSNNLFSDMTINSSLARDVYVTGDSNSNVIENSLLQGGNYSVYVDSSDSNNFTSNNITQLRDKNAVYLTSADNNRFVDVNVSGGSNMAGFNITSGSGNDIINNTIASSSIDYYTADGGIGEYDINSQSLEIFDSSYGSIKYLNDITASGSDLSSVVTIGNNDMYVDSATDNGLNVSANITIKGLSTLTTSPQMLVDYEDDEDFVECSSDVCTNLSWDDANDIFVFNVTHFTTYKTAESTELYGCGELTKENAVYNLTKDLTTDGTCFTIEANNVTIDGNGYNVTGDETGNGVNVNGYNETTIKDLEIYDFDGGIYLDSSSNNNLTSITTNSNTYGIYLDSSSNNNLTSITTNSNNYGIYLELGSSNNIFNNITANSNVNHGITVYSSSDNNEFDDLAIYNCSTGGSYSCIRVYNADDNVFSSGVVNKSGKYLIRVRGSSAGNNFTDLVLDDSVSHGVYTEETSGSSRFKNLTMSNIGNVGFEITNGSGTQIINNTFSSITGVDYNIYDGSVSDYDINSQSLEIFDNSYGSIRYLNDVTASGDDLSSVIIIGDNDVFVNSSLDSGFNQSANITITGLSVGETGALVDWNDDGSFEECPDSVCTDLSWDGSEFKFNVSHFTTYKADNDYPSITWETPTPADGDIVNDILYLNASVSDMSQTSAWFDWNNSLLGYWSFEYTNSTGVYDNSSYDSFGTFENGLAESDNVSGKFGQGMTFDGTGYIDTQMDYDLSGNGPFSVFIWIKDHAGGSSYVVAQADKAGYSSDWILGYYNGGLWADGNCVDGSDTVADGNWHQLGFTFDGTNSRLYIDGDYTGSCVGPDLEETGLGSVKIMANGEGGSQATGKVDEVKIWKRVLSSEEINASYNNGLHRLYHNFTDLSSGSYNYSAYAIDSLGNLNITDERTVTVDVNNPPTTPTPEINSSDGSNHDNQDLNCYDTIIDSDGDNMNVSVKWYKDDVLNLTVDYNNSYANNHEFNAVLDSGNTSVGDTWKCSMRLYDGQDYSSWANSSSLFVTDSTPPTITWENPTPSDGDTINYNDVYLNTTIRDTLNTSAFFDWNNSLLGYWNFENTNATGVFDNSTIDNFGIFSGGLTESDKVTGKYGKAMAFDGTSDYINLGGAAGESYDAMTIEAWIKRTADEPSGWRTPLHRNDDTIIGSSVFFIGLESSSHDITATIGAGASGPDYKSGSTTISAALNTWYHVVCAWDGSTGRVYVDGTEITSYALTANDFQSLVSTKGSAVTRIGASGDSSGYLFKGEVDEVKIYSRALSPEEINASYNNGLYRLYHNFTDRAEGTYNYSTYAIDTGGNLDITEERSVETDTTAPSITWETPTPADGGDVNDTLYLNASVSDMSQTSAWFDFNKSLVGYWGMDWYNSSGVYDNSTYSNFGEFNGGLSSDNITDGMYGDALEFDGDDYLDPGTVIDVDNKLSVEGWVKDDGNSNGAFVGKHDDNSHRWHIYLYNSGDIVYWNIGGGDWGESNLSDLGTSWHHLVMVYDGSKSGNSNRLKAYVDGKQINLDFGDKTIPATMPDISNNVKIGTNGDGNYFSGKIDEVKIYSRALSSEEINASYNNSEHRLERNFTDLDVGEYNYSAYAIDKVGNLNVSDEREVTLNISNTAPEIELLSPDDGNITTNRAPTFVWNGTDAQGDSLEYEINISLNASSLCEEEDINQVVYQENYTISPYLKCLSDNDGDFYEWTVRACENETDEGYCSEWASEWNISIQSNITISLPTDTMNFGSMGISESNDTTNDDPQPFNLRNEGNARVNVSVNATDLWESVANPSDYFMYKIRNKSGCYVNDSTNNIWTQTPSITGHAINELNFTSGYQEGCNNVDVDIKAEVPGNEEGGNKSSIITFISSLGE